MDLDYSTASSAFKLLILVILAVDLVKVLRPLPRPGKTGTDRMVWQTRTSMKGELSRQGLNTGLFPGVLGGLAIADIRLGLDLWIVMLDISLLVLVILYIAYPRTLALFGDGSLWLDGARLDRERLAGFEVDRERPHEVIVLTSWHNMLVRKRVVLDSADEVEELVSSHEGRLVAKDPEP